MNYNDWKYLKIDGLDNTEKQQIANKLNEISMNKGWTIDLLNKNFCKFLVWLKPEEIQYTEKSYYYSGGWKISTYNKFKMRTYQIDEAGTAYKYLKQIKLEDFLNL